jgi:hypothetical protein
VDYAPFGHKTKICRPDTLILCTFVQLCAEFADPFAQLHVASSLWAFEVIAGFSIHIFTIYDYVDYIHQIESAKNERFKS